VDEPVRARALIQQSPKLIFCSTVEFYEKTFLFENYTRLWRGYQEENMNIETKIELSPEEEKTLQGILHCDNKKLKQYINKFASASIEEYCRMILGQKVFTRFNDIREYRLFLIIKEVFNNRIPDDQIISDLFQTTPSESRSLSRSIASKYQYELREAISETLKEIISNASEKNGKYVFTSNSSTKVEELNKILISIDGTLPKIKKDSGSVSQYLVEKSSYNKLKEHFKL